MPQVGECAPCIAGPPVGFAEESVEDRVRTLQKLACVGEVIALAMQPRLPHERPGDLLVDRAEHLELDR